MSSDVADKQEIRDLKYRYCYATDELDTDEIVELMTADATIDIPIYGLIEGHEEMVEYFEWFGEQTYEVRSHNVFNPLLTVDGDTATGKWYYMVVYPIPGGNVEVGMGQYDDEYVRTDDGWKISSLVATRRITREVTAARID